MKLLKKSVYADGHKKQATIAYREECYLKRTFGDDIRIFRWMQITHHVDDHSSFHERMNTSQTPFGER